MDGGAWWATVHEVAKSQARLSDFTKSTPSHGLVAHWDPEGCDHKVQQQ